MIITVTAALVVAEKRGTSYQSQAVVVVSSSHTSATTQDGLATTYTELIGQDDAVIAAAAQATRTSLTVARGDIAASQVAGTSIIDIDFNGNDARQAQIGAAAVVNAVTGAHPVSSSIPAGALDVVSASRPASKQGRSVPGGPIPIGIVLGFLVGIAVLTAWDRQDSRIVSAATLEHEVGLPVTVLRSKGTLVAMQARWTQLAGVPEPTIALVGATCGAQPAEVAEQLLAQAPEGIEYALAAVVGDGGDGDIVAMRADLVVLVVRQGGRIRDVRRTIADLTRLGASPRWAVLANLPA
jgi:capsular polysaccharide biosynthesis protein